MSEYWLISAPGDKTCQQTWETMNNLTSKQNSLCVNYKFHIPDLKVGTLDQLVGLSDDLGKLDAFVEQVTRKVAAYLGEVLEDQRDKLHENLMANNSGGRPPDDRGGGVKMADEGDATSSSGVYDGEEEEGEEEDKPPPLLDEDDPHTDMEHEEDGEEAVVNEPSLVNDAWGAHHNHPLVGPGDLPSYLTRFQWDIAKYPIKQSLRNIADIISKQVGQIENDLKTKSSAYNNLKGSLQSLEKKQTGSLLTRNLADLVKKEHFILDSDYLQTLLVIVPKSQFNEWNATYEKITDMIVPRSSQLIVQDGEYGLFTVSLFKKVIDEFKHHAREKKFIVRDFTYNEEELAAGKNEITKLVTDKKKQFGPLVRWLKVNFSECFCAWIHVKALRVFVESVLRYGLPVNFQAILIHPHKKTMKRLRDVLSQLYGHLDGSVGHTGGHVDNVDIPGLGFGQSEYYPYVYYKINVDMIDSKA
ncbi:V-type proton ATPase subunit C isoform X2 [Cylas formicarius]|uniref:V-type proton ATPase subunit C isoform X2 n=1 Tax=Cylas formicarius TaxID=197179 RepID=UPI002958A053|nr:V-type proton ATPase subunit C isoform X2 [Cylas formicarius]